MVEFDSIEEVINRQMDDIADFVLAESQENILKNKSTGVTGNLLKLANVNRKFLEKQIVYSVPYAAFVEFGSEPHFVSPNDLIKWVEVKLKLKGRHAWAVATVIADNITRNGLEEKPFLRPAIKSAIRRFG